MWPFDPPHKELYQRIRALEEHLAALQDSHERLRGRFYQSRGDTSPPPTETKAEILRRMGYR